MNWICQIYERVKELPAPLLCGLAGMATIGLASGLHALLCRVHRRVQDERKNRQRMKGVVLRSYQGLESVEVRSDLLMPSIMNGDEVLIKVFAAGIDPMDHLITKGYGKSIRSYLRHNNEHVDDESTIILGRECSGVVEEVGNNVTTLQVGDKVWAVSPYCLEGLMAEYVVVKESQVALKPRNLSFEEAASIPYTSMQMCNAILNQGCLNPESTKGKRILLITGNSPIGLLTMQLLKAWGADVTTVVPTAGLPMCHVLGADDVIVYSVTNFEIELRKRKRFDFIFNAAGTIVHPLCVNISSPGGKVVTLTTTPVFSDKFDVVLGTCMALVQQIVAWIKKFNHGMLGCFWWNNFTFNRTYLVVTKTFVEEKKISPIIEKVYGIDDAVIALRQLAQYENVGKNVLKIASY